MPWAGRAREIDYTLRLYLKDEQGLWRSPVVRTQTYLGHRVPGTRPIRDVVGALVDRAQGRDHLLLPVMAAWDPRSARSITLHGVVGGEGLETSAGFYVANADSPGVPNRILASVANARSTALEVKPRSVTAFVHTPWGYCLPERDHRIARDYLLTGDAAGAWRRARPNRFCLGVSRARAGADQFFALPHIRRYVMDELTAAAKTIGMTAEHLMAALKEEVDQPAGSRNRLAAIKLGAEVLERHKAVGFAWDATGTDGGTPDRGAFPARMGGPTARPFRVFTNEELSTRRARVAAVSDAEVTGIPLLNPGECADSPEA